MEVDKLEAGPELNKLVCVTVGIQPRLSWEALSADETATCCSFETKAEGEAWFERQRKEFPSSWTTTYHLGQWAIYPNVSGSLAAAWEVVEKMRADGWMFHMDDQGGDPWWAEFATNGYKHGGQDSGSLDSLVICRAALKAMADKLLSHPEQEE